MIFRRLQYYGDVYRLANQKVAELEESKNIILDLTRQLTAGSTVEIDRVLYHREIPYIVIKKTGNVKLSIGDHLKVFDVSDGAVMGTFEVTESLRAEYRARCVGRLNSLWLGYIHRAGVTVLPPPPYTVAVLLPKTGEDNEY